MKSFSLASTTVQVVAFEAKKRGKRKWKGKERKGKETGTTRSKKRAKGLLFFITYSDEDDGIEVRGEEKRVSERCFRGEEGWRMKR